MPKTFNITIIRPKGFLFSEVFREMAETVTYGLRGLGYDADLTENTAQDDRMNIIFGGHMLQEGVRLPTNLIIYNWEQTESYEAKPNYYDLARKYPVWDYSPKNIKAWKSIGVAAKYVPLGYMPEMTRIPKREVEDIPVLFLGSMNDRRMCILNALLDAGIKFEWPPAAVFGADRDELVSRAKIILNVHFHNSSLFEMSRVGYMLANKKLVVSEPSYDVPEGLRGAFVEVDFEKIVDACKDLLEDNSKREELAQRGFDIFSKIDEREILRGALAP